MTHWIKSFTTESHTGNQNSRTCQNGTDGSGILQECVLFEGSGKDENLAA